MGNYATTLATELTCHSIVKPLEVAIGAQRLMGAAKVPPGDQGIAFLADRFSRSDPHSPFVPAKAGTQRITCCWIPAFAGMNGVCGSI